MGRTKSSIPRGLPINPPAIVNSLLHYCLFFSRGNRKKNSLYLAESCLHPNATQYSIVRVFAACKSNIKANKDVTAHPTVRKYRQLVRTLKQTRVEQVILSGILPVMGRRGHKYRNCRGMAINMLVQKLCREEEVGFVDLWGSFVGRADMYMKDGLHLSGKGAAVFADKLSAAVDSDLGTMTNIFGSKHSLN